MSTGVPIPVRMTGWDRAAIMALGAAGCALSYDALQQIAVAIHVRGVLTYLFPLVIDGFIAYGVRALVVLRAARFAARLYVWTLFGTATSASIWANALHAVRLNEQFFTKGELRLGDTAVGVLSTIAPLALAGAVHLYILIARRVTETAVPAPLGHLSAASHHIDRIEADQPDTTGAGQVTVTPGQQPAELTGTPGQDTDSAGQGSDRASVTTSNTRQAPGTPPVHDTAGHRIAPMTDPLAAPVTRPAQTVTRAPGQGVDQGGHPEARPAPVTWSHGGRPVTSALETVPVTHPGTPVSGDRTADPVTEELLPIARKAVTDTGRATRAVVAEAIRGQGLPLSNQRLTDLMRAVRDEPGQLTQDRVG